MKPVNVEQALAEFGSDAIIARDIKPFGDVPSAYQAMVLDGMRTEHQLELAATATTAKAPVATHPHVSPQLHAAPRGPSGNSFH